MKNNKKQSRIEQVRSIVETPGFVEGLNKLIEWPADLDPAEGWDEAREKLLNDVEQGKR